MSMLSEAPLVVCLLVLAVLVERGNGQTTCYNSPFFSCAVSAESGTAPSMQECCDRGNLAAFTSGFEICEVCPLNGICYAEGDSSCSSAFPGIGASTIHDCCLVNPAGASYVDRTGNCKACSSLNFQCFSTTGCDAGDVIAELSGAHTKSSREACCDTGSGLSYSFNGQCVPCIVFGWITESLEEREAGQGYPLSVGYIKGGDEGNVITANIEVMDGGTAVLGSDFSLNTNRVRINPRSSTDVLITLRVDGVAQEDIETATLILVHTAGSLPLNALFKDQISISIEDSNTLSILFGENDYRANEGDERVRVIINKNEAIANPVTILIQPLTVDQVTPIPDNVPPDDNRFSPNRARSSPEDRMDFSNEVIEVTFAADEAGSRTDDLEIFIPIRDDDIDEAEEEVFIALLSIENATNTEDISIGRISTLLRIVDNDDIMIGFQQEVYTFEEPEFETEINGRVFLEKEGGQITEQTFSIAIDVSTSTQNVAIRPATADVDFGANSVIVEFPPEQQTLDFPFTLFPDTLPEGLEGFSATSSSTGAPAPAYQSPINLFATTFIVLADNDRVEVGFEEDYIVRENVTTFEACVRVLNVGDEDPLIFDIPLLIDTVAGTAGELDYTPIRSEDLIVSIFLDQDTRRQCFDVQIIEDSLFEPDETFSLSLILDTFGTDISSSVTISKNMSLVTILDNDDFCPDLALLVNGTISYAPDMTGPLRDVGTVATHTCDDGFVLVGSETRECQSGTTWSETPPTCEPICTDLALLENGAISYAADMTEPFRDVGTVATHTCDDGFVLIGSETRECLEGGSWSETPPTCEPIECPNLDAPVNGMISFDMDQTPDFELGTVASYECDNGFVLVGIEDRNCTGGDGTSTMGVWTGDAPTCEPICTDLALLENGAISYYLDMTEPFRDIGTVATHTCDDGFILVGSETRECEEGGSWSETPPTCEPIECPNLDAPVNGMISFDMDQTPDFELGTVASYECDNGFVLVGIEDRNCTGGDGTSTMGVWTGDAPTCEPICTDLALLENGAISYAADMTEPFRDIGTVATHTCDDGFVLVGSETRECLEGGTWSDAPPTCEPICTDLALLGNGAISYAADMTEPFRDIGTVATHTCDDGFVLVGSETRECLEGGSWSETPPTCEPICTDLALLENGAISYYLDMTEPFRDIGTVATHTCDDGFVLVGSETRECEEGGTWSEAPPTCEPICTDLALLENGAISYYLDMTEPFRDVGTVATHTCSDGFVLVGSETRECEEGGTWSDAPPSCEPIECSILDDPVNGMISFDMDQTPDFELGTVASYECDNGFVLVGIEDRNCTGGDGTSTMGVWTGDAPTCEPICTDLALLENGAISYYLDMTEPFRDIGTVATHTCNDGFVLVGSETRECLEGGSWSDAPPVCEPDPECPDLAQLVNGEITYSPDTTPPTRMVGTTATHVCDTGFTLVGNVVRTCQEDTTFSGQPPFCQATDVRQVNDTAMGDPLMTVPLYLANTSALPNLQDDQILHLCFEVHGETDEYFNLVSDSCINVNSHYKQPMAELGYNIIDEIAVRAVGNDNVCHNISVAVGGCQATIDNALLEGPYSSAGISVRMFRNRVRIAAPNCQNLDLVMWVFCEEGTFVGDPDLNEPEITINTDMIRFVIARGFNIRETAHGILGQFWNIPIDVERYTGPLQDGSIRDDTYIVTVNYPDRDRRRFLSMLDIPLWDKRKKEYCLYAGNSQGGRIYELVSPNDPVIEGEYTDYIISDSFGVEFSYSHFDTSQCAETVPGPVER